LDQTLIGGNATFISGVYFPHKLKNNPTQPLDSAI